MKELKKLIKDSGRKKTWIAKELNMPYITLNSYLYGKFKMPKEVEKRIKKLL